MKQTIKIYFTDFWSNFNKNDNYFLDIIKMKYDVVLDPKNPDFLMYSCFGTDFLKYNCIRIYFIGESFPIYWKDCDWAFSSHYINNSRHYRLPIYAYMNEDVAQLTIDKKEPQKILAEKTGFCNFIYSNPACKARNNFFKHLCQYKKVDSAGRLMNNVSYRVDNKIEFLKKYKFTIAFENSEYNGYTTEKIYEPFLANSIPIYWGNPLVSKDFNTKAFLNYYDFPSEDALIKQIIEIDNDDNLFMEYISQPAFVSNKLNEFVEPTNVLAQFEKIFNAHEMPLAQKHSPTIRPFINLTKRLRCKCFWLKYGIKTFSFHKIKKKIQKLQVK